MTGTLQKRAQRAAANEAKGHTTRKYVWKSPPKQKARPPKTKKQLKARFEQDQTTIADLTTRLEETQKELKERNGEILVSHVLQESGNQAAQEQQEKINMLTKAYADAQQDADKWKTDATKWKRWFETLAERHRQKTNEQVTIRE